ncbi:MAG: bifunctional lysylphosphatidylglycerol flippase/synthetase MprF [Candidatus Binatus sp.]|jgi:phosphatidylglycerol lysyltransferase|uniref:bifunctional lysylphosphatidylglycerol flippase/synthetase MprF n=1 Tax=Candidatus Binatus sp. TaxID=2811406 RepID=UPI003C861CFF
MGERPLQSNRPLISRAKVLRRIVAPIVALAACALLLVFLHGLSRGLDYHGVTQALRETPRGLIWISILLTALSYLALVVRDQCALSYVGVRVSTPAVLLASFCGSALGNAVSFKALTGDTVRERVYGAVSVRPEQTARVMLFINVAFGISLAAFMAGSLMLAGSAIGRLLPVSIISIRCAGAMALLAILAALLLRAWGRKPVAIGRLSIEMPSLTITLLQLVASTVDLAAAAGAFWFLLPRGEIDFFSFAAVFSAATVLGVISRIPGGLGVFDVVVFLALRRFVPSNQLVAALLIYRGVYFLLPLLLAAASLAGLELRSVPGSIGSKAGERASLGAGLLAPIFLSAVTFAVGAMLIVSGATPALDWRLAALQGVLPLWAVEISHLLATLAGVFLLFVARGLYNRLDGAWWLALIVALVNVAFSLAKGLAFGETAAIVFLVCLLLATRREFTRPAAFMHQTFRLGWFIAIAIVIACAIGILLFAFRDVAYRREIWWQFEFDAQASRSLRAILGASILALGISAWQLLRTAPGRVEPPSAQDLLRAATIIHDQERSAAMLALMGDKSFLFSSSGNSFLMYAKRGRSWVGLFDPVGRFEEWPELVWRFVELADKHGGRAAFYQVRPDSLPLYLDAGLRVVKVGEEACIYLERFSLEGSERYGLRQALKRGEREGLTFQILTPQRVCQQQDVLNEISERWLGHHRGAERRFSVAGYEPRFVAAQSAALSWQDGKPLAFVTFMTTDLQTEATVGLMRQVPGAPTYTMEFMFTKLALELKARGFKSLSLGMAPLAGIARTPLSSRWHRIAGLVWEHGKPIYNFQGLRGFKNKFRPAWEPRYLAASGAAGPFITLADVAALASGYSRGPSST